MHLNLAIEALFLCSNNRASSSNDVGTVSSESKCHLREVHQLCCGLFTDRRCTHLQYLLLKQNS